MHHTGSDGNSPAREVCSVSERELFDETPMDTAAGEVYLSVM